MQLPLYYPAFFTSGCCIIGAIVNELRSMPMSDHVAEVAVFLLFSAVRIRQGSNSGDGISGDGVAGALAASFILFLFSLPRLNKGPVPAALFASTAAYYLHYAIIIFANEDSALGASQNTTIAVVGSPSFGGT